MQLNIKQFVIVGYFGDLVRVHSHPALVRAIRGLLKADRNASAVDTGRVIWGSL